MDKGAKENEPPQRFCIHCTYLLAGLPDPRCPECGMHFDPDDARTWSTGASDYRRITPIAASFSGAILGGSIAHGATRLYDGYTSETGHVTDANYIAYWTAILVVGWWALILVPGLLLDRRLASLRSRWLALSIGALSAVGALWLVLGGAMRSSPVAPAVLLTLCAALVGISAATAAFAGSRRRWVRSAAGPPCRVVVLLWVVGPMCLALWMIAIWPVLCHVSPDIAYRVGGDQTRHWAIRFVLEQVQVGDSASKLRSMLPSAFGTNAGDSSSGLWLFQIGGDTIEVRTAEDKISRITKAAHGH